MKLNISFMVFLSSFLCCSCTDIFTSNNEYIETVKNIPTSYGTIENILVEMFTASTTKESKLIPKDKLIWEIEGSTNEGEIVTCKYEDIKVVIPTIKDGDYIKILPFSVYYIKNGKIINDYEIISDKWRNEINIRQWTKDLLKTLGPDDKISTKPSKVYEEDNDTVNDEYLNKGAE